MDLCWQSDVSAYYYTVSVQLIPVAQLCPNLYDSMDYIMPGFPVHHQLLELAHTHVHQVGNAIQPSDPRLSPSPSAFNLSQHQGLCQSFLSKGESVF